MSYPVTHRRSLANARWAVVLGVLFGVNAPTAAQICAPAPGVKVPAAALRMVDDDRRAFQLSRSWVDRAGRNAAKSGAKALSGTFVVPLLPVMFANSAFPPFPPAALEQALFAAGTSESASPTVTQVYDEMSQGRLRVEGDVMDWTQLDRDDTWYEGTTSGLDNTDAHIGELIFSTLSARDGAVDFGRFDNDGPDGVPNSGDDDGYVDLAMFVHSEGGGECGSENIWSHRWTYRAWPRSGGAPFVTNDVRANGGPILIDDYAIVPGLGCDSQTVNDIGIFCHEIGHAFGLPDLYDLNGGGAGLGHWCLMASGNWNTPQTPAHMSAWCKQQLGWVETVIVEWRDTPLNVAPVVDEPVVYELPVREDRWRRRDDCPLKGTQSMTVGLFDAEPTARAWPVARGYGNAWRETVAREFAVSPGAGPVTIDFDYRVETEEAYDFVLVVVEVDGEENTMDVFNGHHDDRASYTVPPAWLGDSSKFTLKFRFTSDGSFSSEDGRVVVECAPFAFDDVVVQQAASLHRSDFEDHRDGWFAPRNERDNPVSEVFLIENRQRSGTDAALHGEGLAIYHVDRDVIRSQLGNTGGDDDRRARAIVLEEADGLGNLVAADGGRGDEGDLWPGLDASRFDAQSVPSSRSNSGRVTPVSVDQLSKAGAYVSCLVRAGDPAPRADGLEPGVVDLGATSGGVVHFELVGAGQVLPGARLRLVRSGRADLVLTTTWTDYHVVTAEAATASLADGIYDVVVENPDGQTAVLVSALAVDGGGPQTPTLPSALSLAQNYPNPFNPSTTLDFALSSEGDFRLDVYDERGRHVRRLDRGSRGAGYYQTQWDGLDDAGRTVASGLYFARLVAGGTAQQRKMMLIR